MHVRVSESSSLVYCAVHCMGFYYDVRRHTTKGAVNSLKDDFLLRRSHVRPGQIERAQNALLPPLFGCDVLPSEARVVFAGLLVCLPKAEKEGGKHECMC